MGEGFDAGDIGNQGLWSDESFNLWEELGEGADGDGENDEVGLRERLREVGGSGEAKIESVLDVFVRAAPEGGLIGGVFGGEGDGSSEEAWAEDGDGSHGGRIGIQD